MPLNRTLSTLHLHNTKATIQLTILSTQAPSIQQTILDMEEVPQSKTQPSCKTMETYHHSILPEEGAIIWESSVKTYLTHRTCRSSHVRKRVVHTTIKTCSMEHSHLRRRPARISTQATATWLTTLMLTSILHTTIRREAMITSINATL